MSLTAGCSDKALVKSLVKSASSFSSPPASEHSIYGKVRVFSYIVHVYMCVCVCGGGDEEMSDDNTNVQWSAGQNRLLVLYQSENIIAFILPLFCN